MKIKPSEKKIAANKANAKKSKGPTTTFGKEKSKFNALKHGVYATTTLLPGEDENLYEAIKSEQRSIFKPKTFIDKAMVDQLIGELWNLRRIAKAEHFHLVDAQKEVNKEQPLKLTPVEQEFMTRIEKTEGSERTEADHKMLDKINKKATVTYLDATYEGLFVFDPHGRMQRISLMKRHVLQTILNLEKDLEKRLDRRGKKNAGEDPD
jgi:hypothetical protein